MPLREIEVRRDIYHTHAQFTGAILHHIAQFCVSQPHARDSDLLTALQALAETYRTLAAGIYYEKPPAGRAAGELYTSLRDFLAKVKEEVGKGGAGIARLRDSDILQVLVMLYRQTHWQSNGRPLSRRFIELLRQQFADSPGPKPAESRIIVP